jgi:hypothetical protein
MIFAYAVGSHRINEAFKKKMNLEWFNGCFLHEKYMLHNDDYDQFLMDKSQIKFIRNNYKNGTIFKVRVVYGEDDYIDGVFYYWYNEDIGDRGLIASYNNEYAQNKFKERAVVI